MKVLSIQNKTELKKVICFLSKGFDWSLKKSKIIEKNLILNNHDSIIYGYKAVENNKICGAFLLFNQGKFSAKENVIKIINISSWYVLPDFRGSLPLIMIRVLIKENSNSIITNLTPNLSAQKIMKAFGFKSNNIFNLKFNILYLIKKYFFEIIPQKKILILNNFKRDLKIKKNFSFLNLKQIDFKVENQVLSIIYSEITWEKKFKIFNINIKGTRILWVSNFQLYSKYFFKINLLILLRNQSFFCTTHCKLSKKYDYFKNDNYQLILNPNNIDLKEISSSYSLGSELNFL